MQIEPYLTLYKWIEWIKGINTKLNTLNPIEGKVEGSFELTDIGNFSEQNSIQTRH